jgi:hypothetical protein
VSRGAGHGDPSLRFVLGGRYVYCALQSPCHLNLRGGDLYRINGDMHTPALRLILLPHPFVYSLTVFAVNICEKQLKHLKAVPEICPETSV